MITQPLSPQSQGQMISKAQAEQDALNAAGSGTVLKAHRDRYQGAKIWEVDISQPGAEFTIHVDAHTGSILEVIQPQPLAGKRYITKAEAEQIALNAVGGGKVLLVRLEKNDNPPVWSVDLKAKTGKEYEVQVNAYTGAVVQIIPGG